MDEEKNQTTENGVYSYGEPTVHTEDVVEETTEDAQPEEEKETTEEKRENKFAYQDNQYDYTQQYSQSHPQGMSEKPMDLKDWILTLVILMVPCVGIVMYFVWAFGNNGNVNRRNFCRAQLIIFAVLLVIYLVFFSIFGAVAFTQIGLY